MGAKLKQIVVPISLFTGPISAPQSGRDGGLCPSCNQLNAGGSLRPEEAKKSIFSPL